MRYKNIIGKILSRQLGENRLVISEAAESGAEDMLERIKRQELRIEVLPDNYSQFAGELEENDYLSFSRFVRSVYGKRIIKMLEDEDAEELGQL